MDPDRSAEDVLRTVPASVATPTSGRTDAEVARERATRRGAMRADLERTAAATDLAGVAPPTVAG